MMPCQSVQSPPPPPPSSPLVIFMHELRKARDTELRIQIQEDNARSPPTDANYVNQGYYDETSVNALYRPRSLPMLSRNRDAAGGRLRSSRGGPSPTNLPDLGSEQRMRPNSMPTMSLGRRQNSASRWEHGCHASPECKERMNAAWTAGLTSPPPSRRRSAEGRIAPQELQRVNSIEKQFGAFTTSHDQLPDYEIALKFVQRQYAPPRTSSLPSSSSNKARIGSLPALPTRRESLDESAENLFDL